MRIKGSMKWCDLRSNFTNEFIVILADSWRKICACFARSEQVGFAAANSHFASKLRIKINATYIGYILDHNVEKFIIAKHSCYILLANKVICHKSVADRSSCEIRHN